MRRRTDRYTRLLHAILCAFAIATPLAAQEPELRLPSTTAQDLRIAFGPEGRRLAMAAYGDLEVLDLASGETLFTADLGETIWGLDFGAGPDDLIVAQHEAGALRLDIADPVRPERRRLPGTWSGLTATGDGTGVFGQAGAYFVAARTLDPGPHRDFPLQDHLPISTFENGEMSLQLLDWQLQSPTIGHFSAAGAEGPGPTAALIYRRNIQKDRLFLYYDIGRQQVIRPAVLPAETDPRLIAFRETPSGPRVALWYETATGQRVVVYDPAEDRPRLSLDFASGDYRRHGGAALTRDGTALALQRRDGGVDIFATEDATGPLVPPRAAEVAPRLVLTQGHAGTLTDIAVTRAGDVLATLGSDRRVHLWDATNGRQLRSVAEGEFLESLSFSPDGQTLMTLGFKPMFWSVDDGRLELTTPQDNLILGRYIGDAGRVLLCDTAGCTAGTPEALAEGGTPRVALPEPVINATLAATAVSPDGRRAAILLKSGRLFVVDTEALRLTTQDLGHEAISLALTDGGLAVAGTGDGRAILFDTGTGQVRRQLPVTGDPIARALALGGDKVLLSVSGTVTLGGEDQPPREILLDTATGRSRDLPAMPAGVGIGGAGPVAHAPGTGRVFAAGQSMWARAGAPQIGIWSLADESLERVIAPRTVAPHALAFSADGQTLHVDGRADAIHWDLRAGKVTRRRGGALDSISLPAGEGVVYLGTEGARSGTPFFASARQGERALSAILAPGGYATPESPPISNGRTMLLHGSQTDGVFFARFDLAAVAAGGTEPEARFAIPGEPDYGEIHVLSPDGTRLFGILGQRLRAFDAMTGAPLWSTELSERIAEIAVSPDKETVFVRTDAFRDGLLLVDPATGAERPAPAFAADTKLTALLAIDRTGAGLPLALGEDNRITEVAPDGTLTDRAIARSGSTPRTARLSPDHARILLPGDGDGPTLLWDREAMRVARLDTRPAGRDGVAFSPDGSLIAIAELSGFVSLWDAAEGTRLARLAMFPDGDWAVVGNDGRYDSSDPGDMPALAWVLPESPRSALPLELFFREYFEPALLPRLVNGETFDSLPPLGELNRAQPLIAFEGIAPDPARADSVTVTLSARPGAGAGGLDTVKLFRDGQLVAQSEAGLIPAGDSAADLTLSFPGIRLPASGAVDFSAYGFNADGIKSATVRRVHSPVAQAATAPRTAYVVSIGVDSYENPAWDLNFAAADAALSAETLAAGLAESYDRVVPVTLLSSRRGGRMDARRPVIEAVLRRLAGATVPEGALDGIPGAEALAPAGPQDLVYLFFAGHGFAAEDGRFHLFPQDIGPGGGRHVDAALLSRTLDSDRLTALFRDIQARDLVLVIDACNSAASVEGLAFKPGPMGSRGLGQLAYDKGMRVLTASQAEGVAMESAVLRHGALSYAMFREGVEGRKADRAPEDGRVSLAEMLGFAEERVPALYSEITEGSFIPATRGGISLAVVTGEAEPGQREAYLQRPSLFDFRDNGRAEAIYLGGGGAE